MYKSEANPAIDGLSKSLLFLNIRSCAATVGHLLLDDHLHIQLGRCGLE